MVNQPKTLFNLERGSYDQANYENKINNTSALFHWNIPVLLSSHVCSPQFSDEFPCRDAQKTCKATAYIIIKEKWKEQFPADTIVPLLSLSGPSSSLAIEIWLKSAVTRQCLVGSKRCNSPLKAQRPPTPWYLNLFYKATLQRTRLISNQIVCQHGSLLLILSAMVQGLVPVIVLHRTGPRYLAPWHRAPLLSTKANIWKSPVVLFSCSNSSFPISPSPSLIYFFLRYPQSCCLK